MVGTLVVIGVNKASPRLQLRSQGIAGVHRAAMTRSARTSILLQANHRTARHVSQHARCLHTDKLQRVRNREPVSLSEAINGAYVGHPRRSRAQNTLDLFSTSREMLPMY